MSINGGKPVPTFDTMIRNTDPGSNAGLPGLSLFAGMTPGGLPVGIEIDGPVGSDTKLLGTGDVDRSHSGHRAAAEGVRRWTRQLPGRPLTKMLKTTPCTEKVL